MPPQDTGPFVDALGYQPVEFLDIAPMSESLPVVPDGQVVSESAHPGNASDRIDSADIGVR